jgi:hypothetical protein
MSLYGEYYGPADDVDLELVAKRQLNRAMLDEHNNSFSPSQGDVVIFPDGQKRRISHVWTDENDKPRSVQTSNGGSFHWSASGYMSFSGSLFTGIPADTLTWDVAEYANVKAWIFHHDLMSAHRSVDATARVRVWRTTVSAPTS